MQRVFLLMLIVVAFGVVSCSAGNSNEGSADTSTIASPEGLGADTTSAKTDSLRDSLNQ